MQPRLPRCLSSELFAKWELLVTAAQARPRHGWFCGRSLGCTCSHLAPCWMAARPHTHAGAAGASAVSAASAWAELGRLRLQTPAAACCAVWKSSACSSGLPMAGHGSPRWRAKPAVREPARLLPGSIPGSRADRVPLGAGPPLSPC